MKQVFEALSAIENHLNGLFDAADSADAILEREDVDFIVQKVSVCREALLNGNQPAETEESAETGPMTPQEIADKLDELSDELRSYEFQEEEENGGEEGTSS